MHDNVPNRPPAEHRVGRWQWQRSLEWRTMSGNRGRIVVDPATEVRCVCWQWDFRHHFTDTWPRNQAYAMGTKSQTRKGADMSTLGLLPVDHPLLPRPPSLGHFFSTSPLFPFPPTHSFFLTSPCHPPTQRFLAPCPQPEESGNQRQWSVSAREQCAGGLFCKTSQGEWWDAIITDQHRREKRAAPTEPQQRRRTGSVSLSISILVVCSQEAVITKVSTITIRNRYFSDALQT